MTRNFRRFLDAFYRFLLLTSDGSPRALAHAVLFKDERPRYPLSRIFYKKNGRIRSSLSSEIRVFFEGSDLNRWVRDYDTPTEDFVERIRNVSAGKLPILLVFPVGEDEREAVLRAEFATESVGVELSVLILETSGPRQEIADAISVIFAHSGITVVDPRIVIPEDFRCLIWLGEGAHLRRHGAWAFADRLDSSPLSVVAYSDTAEIGPGGIQSHWFKPDFSPTLVEGMTLLGEIFAIRPERARHAFWTNGVPRFGLTERRSFECRLKRQEVEHIQCLLYFLQGSSNGDFSQSNFANDSTEQGNCDSAKKPMISVIIPTRNRWDLLDPCIRSVLSSDWPSDLLEIIVIDNGSDEDLTVAGLKSLQDDRKIRIVRDDGPFNYSLLNNRAAAEARGAVFVFLNNDTVVRDRLWLSKLSAFAMRPGSGAVGAKLLYPDGTVQHAGVVLGIHGGAGHAFVGASTESPGYHGLARFDREVSAVTGACLAVHREAFFEAGGFDEKLKVAFNDIALCSRLTEIGRQNYVLADPLVTHYESKSRGLSTTRSKQIAELKEAISSRQRFNAIWRNDPYYSPNLSLTEPYVLAQLPRRRSPWLRRDKLSRHVLILSAVHQRGYGVPVVIDRHVSALLRAGFRVTVGGAKHSGDYAYPGAARQVFHSPDKAAAWALGNNVDLIWAHTPPFFSVARWVAGQVPIYAYDYGEPPANLFPDWKAREDVNCEKAFSLAMSDRTYAISQAVADESMIPISGVIPLGNDHLSSWGQKFEAKRKAIRAKLGWNDCKVVLNVCRFTSGEQRYKGLDTYVEVMRRFCLDTSQIDGQVKFVICGKGEKNDVEALRASGLEVFANLPDEELVDIYAAADVYANFSRWEGYNLGIGQALAMGLDVVASDIPAHRAFDIVTCRTTEDAARALLERLQDSSERAPRLWHWSRSETEVVEKSLEVMEQAANLTFRV